MSTTTESSASNPQHFDAMDRAGENPSVTTIGQAGGHVPAPLDAGKANAK